MLRRRQKVIVNSQYSVEEMLKSLAVCFQAKRSEMGLATYSSMKAGTKGADAQRNTKLISARVAANQQAISGATGKRAIPAQSQKRMLPAKMLAQVLARCSRPIRPERRPPHRRGH
jgi:hypothetical protein